MPASRWCELRLVEHLGERGDGQVQIAVLLHVEVDEPERCLRQRGAIDLAKLFADSLDAAVEVEHVEVGHQRRCLDRDGCRRRVVAACRGPARRVDGFGVTENRFAEGIDEQPDAILAALRGVCSKLRILCRQHDALGLTKDPPTHQWHDNLRKQRGGFGSGKQEHAVDGD